MPTSGCTYIQTVLYIYLYTARRGLDDRTGRTRQLIQDRQNRTANMGQVEQDKQNRRQNRTDKTGGSGQTGQDHKDRTAWAMWTIRKQTAGPGQLEQTARTRQPEWESGGQVKQDCQNRVVRTVPQGQDNRSRTAVTRHPGQDSQKRTSRMEKHNGTDNRWHVHVEQDCRDRQQMACRTRLPGQDCKDKTTGQP